MISNPLYLASLLISSLLAFFTVALAVEIVVKVFKIQHHRIRSSLRLLPFLALVIDLLSNQYSIGYYINPLSCASCSQKLFMEIFFPELKSYLAENRISLIKYLGEAYQHTFFSTTFILIAATSVLLTLRKLAQVVLTLYSFKKIVQKGTLYNPSVQNKTLASLLKKHSVQIYLSDIVQIPLALHANQIILPHKITKTLTEDEFEAVIAHEFEHIKYKDPSVRPLCHFISSFFWWVPTNSWMNKLEEEQEMSCDMSVASYGLKVESMASALLAVSKRVKTEQALCYLNPTVVRIQTVLGLHCPKEESMYGVSFFWVAAGVFLLLVCALCL